jgi:hypothetical protein
VTDGGNHVLYGTGRLWKAGDSWYFDHGETVFSSARATKHIDTAIRFAVDGVGEDGYAGSTWRVAPHEGAKTAPCIVKGWIIAPE